MGKRVRSSTNDDSQASTSDSHNADAFECPVCLTVRDPTFPFDCGHGVCNGCDNELFCRADDRCPTCRASRLSESINSRMVTPQILQRREVALARRLQGQQNANTMFFPSNVEIIEVNIADFLARNSADADDDGGEAADDDDGDAGQDRHEPQHAPQRPQRFSQRVAERHARNARNGASSVELGDRVRGVISALLNTETVPIEEFHSAIAALRHSGNAQRRRLT